MKKYVVITLLSLGLIGSAYAQDTKKQDKKEMKSEKKMEKGKMKKAVKKDDAKMKKEQKGK